MSTNGDHDPSQPSDPFQPASPAGAAAGGETVGFGTAPPVGASGDVLAAPPGRKRGRGLAIGLGAGAVTLVVVAAGAVWAVNALSGGGEQPEDVVPGNAVAFAKVDFDPSAGQKIAAYRFLKKFPSVDGGDGEGDIKGQIISSLLSGDEETVDYDQDIKPWLGDRAGVAAVPTAEDAQPRTLVAIAVKDEAKAESSLRRILDEDASPSGSSSSGGDTGWGASEDTSEDLQGLVVRDGWAFIGPDQASTEQMADSGQSSPLASSANYEQDMDKVGGDDAVASFWVDVDGLGDLATDPTSDFFGVGAVAGTSGGRGVGVVSFESDAVVLNAKQFGATPSGGSEANPGGPLMQKLPADTTAAFAVGNASETIEKAYEQLEKQAATYGDDVSAEVEAMVGLKLPGDLQRMLGDAFVISVGDVSDANFDVAVRVKTSDPAGSQDVVNTVTQAVAEQAGAFVDVPTIAQYRSSDGVVYALTPTYARLVAGAGQLGEQADFQAALPGAAAANTAFYLNAARLAEQIPDAEVQKNLGPLRAIGFTSTTQNGEGSATLRVVAR